MNCRDVNQTRDSKFAADRRELQGRVSTTQHERVRSERLLSQVDARQRQLIQHLMEVYRRMAQKHAPLSILLSTEVWGPPNEVLYLSELERLANDLLDVRLYREHKVRYRLSCDFN